MNTMSPRHRPEEPLPPPADDGVPNLRRLAMIAARHSRGLTLAGLAGLGLASLWLALARPAYEARALVLMRRPAPLAAGLPDGPGTIPAAELRGELEVMRSRELAGEVLARLGPDHPFAEAEEDPLRDRVRVSRLEESHIFLVEATGPDPESAARLANAVARSYVARREAAAAAAAGARRAALGARVAELRAALGARQAEILAASRAPGGFDEAMMRRGELEQLLESDRAAYAGALSALRAADHDADPGELRASVLSDAAPPLEPKGPKPFMILTLGLFLGLACGGGLALARENLDDTLRTGDEIRRRLGQPFLGYLPRLPAVRSRAGNPAHPVWRAAAAHPRCRYAETLRFLRARAESRRVPGAALTLGLCSARPGEGKSLAAANLAALLAAEGGRTLLIDADLRGEGLGDTFAPEARLGLGDLLAAPESAWIPRRGEGPGGEGLAFLPARGASAPLHVEAEAFGRFLAARRADYDFILVDLPALEEAALTRAILPLLDGWAALVRWGATPAHALRAILREEPGLTRNLLGVLLTDLTARDLRRHTPHAGPAHDG
ncbi:hypothetical protein [Amaricoccus solimangrovi]|uniref:CobQ/CobB/MinD/ParA nucleotide binding domain-containing protein n=1 Tax=Amaricoccus solimangrovi TaxID=2589815 RepID=A0A501WNY3_9RHOB|nr:hypothetical protein [Amaricoccus solimangrovi]TPE49904.1 hypothetical protein FJM51_13140 [Amaricoccus solimangrovi]